MSKVAEAVGAEVAPEVIGVLALALLGWYLYDKYGPSIGQGAQAINPLNNNNVINQGAQAAYQGTTGSSGTIGGDIYDLLHPNQVDPTAPVPLSTQPVVTQIPSDFGITNPSGGWQ